MPSPTALMDSGIRHNEKSMKKRFPAKKRLKKGKKAGADASRYRLRESQRVKVCGATRERERCSRESSQSRARWGWMGQVYARGNPREPDVILYPNDAKVDQIKTKVVEEQGEQPDKERGV